MTLDSIDKFPFMLSLVEAFIGFFSRISGQMSAKNRRIAGKIRCLVREASSDLHFSMRIRHAGASGQPGGAIHVVADDPQGARLVHECSDPLPGHSWRAKNFSRTAQISGMYTVATSQTMCKSTLA